MSNFTKAEKQGKIDNLIKAMLREIKISEILDEPIDEEALRQEVAKMINDIIK